ncbi:MAG: hypothetical protein JRH20_28585 [Deltaproteobacteria bacterium]|nr:hypothetical protein [Deltaproteobacteria bacterium]
MTDDPLFTALRLGNHALPGIWRYLLPRDAQWLLLPAERLASCERCYWVRLGKCREDCRCCTYFPQLPNYLVGLALKDPASRDAMRGVVETGHALPEGLLAAPRHFRLAVQSHAEDRFGEDPELVCPFLRQDDYLCGIHAYRNSICATFFCEHDHSDAGAALWQALQALTGHAETALAQWAMDQAGVSSADYLAQMNNLADDIDALSDGDGLSAQSGWSPLARDTLWGRWLGQECAFFEACADAVMARRDDLYEIACEQPLRQADAYEDALLAWLPEAIRGAATPTTHGEPVPLPELWYQLQLKVRQLWALPFGEGEVQLAGGLAVHVNPKDDRFSRAHDEPHIVRDGNGNALLFCDEAQAAALLLFREPQVLGEALLAREEIEALDDARGMLAECMRRGILVEC